MTYNINLLTFINENHDISPNQITSISIFITGHGTVIAGIPDQFITISVREVNRRVRAREKLGLATSPLNVPVTMVTMLPRFIVVFPPDIPCI